MLVSGVWHCVQSGLGSPCRMCPCVMNGWPILILVNALSSCVLEFMFVDVHLSMLGYVLEWCMCVCPVFESVCSRLWMIKKKCGLANGIWTERRVGKCQFDFQVRLGVARDARVAEEPDKDRLL